MPLTCTLGIQDYASPPGTTGPVVLSVEGEEALHELFRYEVEAAFAQPAPTAMGLLRRRVLLSISCGPDAGHLGSRLVSAVVTAGRDLGETAVGTETRRLLGLRLEPSLAVWDLDEGGEVYSSVTMRDLAVALLEGRPAPGVEAVQDWAIPHSAAQVASDLAPARHQVVRFRESRLAFLRRILADDGLHLLLVHVPPGWSTGAASGAVADQFGAHVAVVADGAGSFSTSKGQGPVAALPGAYPGIKKKNALFRSLGVWQEECAETPWRVAVADSDFRLFGDTRIPGPGAWDLACDAAQLRPAGLDAQLRQVNEGRDLSADADDSSPWAPAGSATGNANSWQARRRGEALLARRRRLRASGDHLLLAPGSTISRDGSSETWQVVRSRLRIGAETVVSAKGALARQPQAVQDAFAALGRALVGGLEGRGGIVGRPDAIGDLAIGWGQGQLSGGIEIEAVPASLPWRPARPAPPVLAGVHTATVSVAAIGANQPACSGDRLGRVKVRFPWATRDSAWLRVAQPLAGAGWGLAGLPRHGDAVAVVFPPDCPDRPLVVGCLPTGQHPLPFVPAQNHGRIALRSRMLEGGQSMPAALPVRGRVGELSVDDGGLWVDRKTDRNASALGFSEVALVDGNGDEDRGLDIFTSGSMREQVAGNRTVRVGGKLVIEAGESIELRVGDTLLRLSPTTTTLGFCNPTFPAIGSLLTINPVMIKGVAPVVDLKGWLRARMGSAASSFTAQGAFAKSKGFSCDMSSDALLALGDMVGSIITVFGSAAQSQASREQGRKDSEYMVAMVKEYILAAVDLVKFIGILAVKTKKTPGDLFGEACIEASAGLASLKAKPPNATDLGKWRTAIRTIQTLVRAGQGGLAFENNQESRDAAKGLSIADGTLTATLGLMNLYDATKGSLSFSTNILTLAPITGFEVKGTWWDKVMAKVNDTQLQSSKKELAGDKTSLKDSKTTGSDSKKALLDDKQQVAKQDGAGVETKQQAAGVEQQVAGGTSEVVEGKTAVAAADRGAVKNQGAIINSVAPS